VVLPTPPLVAHVEGTEELLLLTLLKEHRNIYPHHCAPFKGAEEQP
jgi:hypothetical protein